jgi:cysteine desulfurase/selenocysteine lyase
MSKGSGDDPGRLAPPHEVRGPLGTIGDAGGGHRPLTQPGPVLATSSSPGLSAAGAVPPVGALLPAEDPNTLALLIAKLAGEMFGGASVVPVPLPAQLMTGAGLSNPISPGIAPQLVPGAPGMPDGLGPTSPAPIASSLSPSFAMLGAAPIASAAGPTIGMVSGAPPSVGGHGGGASSPFGGVPDLGASPDLRGGAATDSQDLGALAMPTGWNVPAGIAPDTRPVGVSDSSATVPDGGYGYGTPALHPDLATGQTVPLGANRSTGGQSSSPNDPLAHALIAPSIGSGYPSSSAQQGTSSQQHATSSAQPAAVSSSQQPTVSRSQQPSVSSSQQPSIASSQQHPSTISSQQHAQPMSSQQAPSQSPSMSSAQQQPAFRIPSSNDAGYGGYATDTTTTAAETMPASSDVGMPAPPSAGFGAGYPTTNVATGAMPHGNLDPSHIATGGTPKANVPHVPTGAAPSNPVLSPGVPSGMAPSSSLQSAHPSIDPTGGLPGLSVPSSLAGLGVPGDLSSGMGSGSPFGSPFDASVIEPALLGFPDSFRIPVIDGDELAVDQTPSVRDAGRIQFDPYRVRRDFPILDERVHGKRLVWLDNAATTQKPRTVIERLSHYYEHENSNVHRAAHTLAARATDAYESARETTRKFLNAPASTEIIFVRGATEGINLIAQSWGRRNVRAGDEIVLTWLEHHANIVPWQQLCADTGAKLRIAPVDDRGDVILEEYEKLLGPRTKLVAFTQVSNALGTITPAREMIEIAHRHGALVMLDGAQAVSHMRVDVQQLDCDFYVFSGHKVFAPTGIGVVYGKRDVLASMPPWQGGGNMIQDVRFERTTYQDPPWRFEAGTGNIADAAGLGAALDYIMRIGMDTIDRYEHELLVYATQRLATVPGLTMIGTSRTKAGVLSFVLDGQRTEDVGAALDKDGIAVRSGHHCAQPILRRFGLEASVRASLAFYNVCEDIDALVEALQRLQGPA